MRKRAEREEGGRRRREEGGMRGARTKERGREQGRQEVGLG